MKRKLFRFAAWLALGGCAAFAVAAAVSWFAIEWDGAEDAESYPGGAVLRDASGEIVRVSLGCGDVDCRPYYRADANDWIVKAIVASEDGEFWNHCGVRPLSAMRALLQNVFFMRRVSGASTISMQAVRLIRPHSKGYVQKWIEAVKAIKMERQRDKLWIVSQYLNRAPFGSNFIGIESAAHGWFGKGAKELGIGEAAMLAGMVQAPSRFRPDRGYERALKRRDYVISRMVRLGYITEEQAEGARSVLPRVRRDPRPFSHPFYCDWYVRTAARRAWVAANELSGDFTMPLDADIQSVCEEVVASAAADLACSSAAVVMKVDTGEVVALAASGDYFGGADGAMVNTALAPRPAGSTLKPFLAAQAMDMGLAGPKTLISDRPLAVRGYRPENFDGRFRGDVTLADSLVLSLNIPFVRLCRKVGVESFAGTLDALGIGCGDERAARRHGLGIAIGSSHVTLVGLVGAYCELAASARGDGGRHPFSAAAAYLVTDALSGTERSASALGHVADVEAPRFAWKTGTSSAYRDAWTVMWNPEYVIGVWCGHLRGRFGDKALVGARASAPNAWRIARSLYPGNMGPWFREPKDARRVAAMAPARLGEKEKGLAIAAPEDGAVFCMVEGMGQQRIVCRTVGNEEGGRLWWFMDGVPSGESAGAESFVAEMLPGRHTVACVKSDGTVAESTFTVSSN